MMLELFKECWAMNEFGHVSSSANNRVNFQDIRDNKVQNNTPAAITVLARATRTFSRLVCAFPLPRH